MFGDQRVDDRAFRKAADQAYRDPLLDRRHTQTSWQRRQRAPEQDPEVAVRDKALLGGIGNVVAFIGEWGLWLVVGVLVLALLVTVRHWWPWMRGLARPPAVAQEPAVSEALTLPETLPAALHGKVGTAICGIPLVLLPFEQQRRSQRGRLLEQGGKRGQPGGAIPRPAAF